MSHPAGRPLVLGERGTPILTVHGAIGLVDHRSFRPWLDPLAEQARLVYYDQCVEQLVDPSRVSLESLAAEADEVRARLGFERSVVLGHSGGASLAAEYARRYPERTQGLVLVCMTPRFDHAESVVASIRETRSASELDAVLAILGAKQLDDGELRRIFLDFAPIYFHRYSEDVGRWFGGAGPFRGASFLHWRNTLLPASDSLAWLHELRAPALVIAGRHDLVIPVDRCRQFAEGLPNARFVVFEESSHYPHVDENERFLAEVRAFLADVEREPLRG